MSALLIALSLLARAPTGQIADPSSLDELAACLDVAARDARSACLESAARKLVAASHRQLAAEVRTERFGMSNPRPEPVVRRSAPSSPRIKQLQGSVAAVVPAPAGQWSFVLTDGSRWVTQESGLSAPPYVGQTLVIKRAALGSYRVIFHRERPVQVKRLG